MSIVRLTAAALSLGCAYLSWAETSEDVLAYKRRIHEQVTGQRLDENGRTVMPQVVKVNGTAASKVAMLKSSSPLVVSNVRMKQRDNSMLVDIYYDLSGGNGGLCKVEVEMCDNGQCIYARSFEGENDGIGDSVRAGKNKHFVWDAGADWPDNFSKKVTAKIMATETDIPSSFHTIRVKWYAYGGRDLDICGYWVDHRTDNVGWSWGNGSSDRNCSYYHYWHGDNTDRGPEIIDVSLSSAELTSNRKKRQYRIHFNYFGELGSPCMAEVAVDGTSLSKSSKTAKRLGTRAETRDPSLTITFDENGHPISID